LARYLGNVEMSRLKCIGFSIAVVFTFNILSAVAASSSASAKIMADTILYNGAIYTVDNNLPWAQAIAIQGDKILAVGSDKDIKTLQDSETRSIDLQGRMVMPGIVDVHAHVTMGMLAGIRCFLPDTFAQPTVEKITSALRECDEKLPGEGWLYGYRFSAGILSQEDKNAKTIDKMVSHRPVLVEDEAGHTLIVNSLGLEILRKNGVSENSEVPEGGTLGIGKDGKLSGYFGSTARNLLPLESSPTEDDMNEAMQWGIEELFRQGTTALMEPLVFPHEETNYWQSEFAAWRQAFETEPVMPRVNICGYMGDGSYPAPPVSKVIEAFEAARLPKDVKRCAKIYGDGVLEAGTAALVEEYDSESGLSGTGNLGFQQKELNKMVAELDANDLSVKIHSLGDRTVRSTLNAYEPVIKERGGNPLRHHVAHITVVHPDDYSRFQELDVPAEFIGATNALIPYVEGGYLRALGEERFHNNMQPAQALVNHGAILAANSDWGAALLDNMRSIETVITRMDIHNPAAPIAGPSNRVDVPTAIAMHTINGAYILRREQDIGSLEVGKKADLIVLDQNLFLVPKTEIHNTKVLLTLVGGAKAWQQEVDWF